jgi:hypothetical protein
MAATVRVDGLPAATSALERLRGGAEAVGRTRLAVGATAPYARFVERGTRSMRGRFFLRRALEAVEGRLVGRVVAALPQGAQPAAAALLGLGPQAVRIARGLAPVRTGRLRDSIYHRSTGRS